MGKTVKSVNQETLAAELDAVANRQNDVAQQRVFQSGIRFSDTSSESLSTSVASGSSPQMSSDTGLEVMRLLDGIKNLDIAGKEETSASKAAKRPDRPVPAIVSSPASAPEQPATKTEQERSSNASSRSNSSSQDVDDLARQVEAFSINKSKQDSSRGTAKTKSSQPSKVKPSQSSQTGTELLMNRVLDGQDQDQEVLNSNIPEEELKVKGLKVDLYPHQTLALRFMKEREASGIKSGLVCDDMGLGKTIQMLSLIIENPREKDSTHIKSTLIICPVGLTYQWENEIKTKTEGLSCIAYRGSRRFSLGEKLPSYDVVITSYKTATNDSNSGTLFGSHSWHRVVFDEAQSLRNSETVQYKAIANIKAERKWGLTGTPLQNDIYDIQSLLSILNFRDVGVDWDSMSLKGSSGRASEKEFKSLRAFLSKVMIRRTKKILPSVSLKPKRVHRRAVKLLPEEDRAYKGMLAVMKNARLHDSYEDWKTIFDANPRTAFGAMTTLLMRSRQMASYWKMLAHTIFNEEIENPDETVGEFFAAWKALMRTKTSSKMHEIGKILNQDKTRKTIIFTCFVKGFDSFAEDLKKLGYKSLFYHGDMKPDERWGIIEEFDRDDSITVLLASFGSAAVGLNLTMASRVIFLDPWWNPAVHDQACDRVYRIGQKRDVDVYEIYYEDTVESNIYDLLGRKKELSEAVVQVNLGPTSSSGYDTRIMLRVLGLDH